MFVLVEFEDTVRIPPCNFNSKLNDVIVDELNKKLANKVYQDIGLCITLYDITKIEESFIFPRDGASHTTVSFRYIVFRPWMEEILIGKIRSCSPEGVHVTLGFFEDIVIPPYKLQHQSRFDQMEQAWVWIYKTEDGETHDLFMDAGEVIRFRVVKEMFTEALPPASSALHETTGESETNIAPYILHGSIDEPGLGLLSWWENA